VLEPLTELVSASPWTYALVLGVAAADALFPFFPSETAAIAAGVLAGAGELSIAFVIAAAAAGAFIGDNSSYAVGRTAGRPLLRGEKTRRRLGWAERKLDERGGYLLVAARFIPGGRTATTLTAGVTRMRWTRFLRYTALAAVLWASFAGGLGYLGGRAFEDRPLLGLAAALALAATVTLGVELARRVPRARACPTC
jgi:membrane protein DedA with SNARE-associated domain